MKAPRLVPNFTNNMRAEMKAKNLTIALLSKLSGCNDSTLSRVLSHNRGLSLRLALDISNALGRSILYMVSENLKEQEVKNDTHTTRVNKDEFLPQSTSSLIGPKY